MELRHPVVRRSGALLAVVGLVGALAVSPATVGAQTSIVKKQATGELRSPTLTVSDGTKTLVGPSGGLLTTAKAIAVDGQEIRDEEADAADSGDIQQLAITRSTLGCGARNTDGNVRANQDCTFRRQAEEIIKINPSDPSNIVAGQNDSRVGYNKCGIDYSFDSGEHWGDQLPPFYQRENHPELDGPGGGDPNKNTILGGTGTAHTYDAGSDPALTFDSANRAFFSCIVFDVNDNATGVLVTQSPQGAGGSFFDNVSARRRPFVVVEDNSPLILHDKEFIIADTFASSPNRDNVYVTWTVFRFGPNCLGGTDTAPTFCSSPIFGSMSTDHAVTWSTPEEISGASSLCVGGNILDPTQPPNACNFDQGSDPEVLPDGNVVVAFFNQNTPTINDQQLAVVCHPSGSSTTGTAHLHCAAPAKVGDDITVHEPQCDFGRGPEECVPGPWIRTNDFPRIALDKDGNSLYTVWQDYRNAEYDVQVSRSNDGGKTWNEGGTLNGDRGTDHYMPAVDVGTNHRVAASYFDSHRVPNENSTPPGGFSPGMPGVQKEPSSYFLSGKQQASGSSVDTPFTATQVSPSFPPPDGIQAGFNGDYSGIAVTGSTAHPIWSDTRNKVVVTSPTQGVFHDEDVFTDRRAIPGG